MNLAQDDYFISVLVRKESTCGICPVHHYCVQGSCVCMPGYVCPGENQKLNYVIQMKRQTKETIHLFLTKKKKTVNE